MLISCDWFNVETEGDYCRSAIGLDQQEALSKSDYLFSACSGFVPFRGKKFSTCVGLRKPGFANFQNWNTNKPLLQFGELFSFFISLP